MLEALGDYRVGVSFNPSKLAHVDHIKRLAADLINYLELIREGPPAQNDAEIARLLSLAQTHIEDGAMWGVKAVTKQPRPPAVPGPLKPAKRDFSP